MLARVYRRRAAVPPSQLLDVAGGDVLGWVGVPVDVALGLVAEATLQLVGVRACFGGKPERERVP